MKKQIALVSLAVVALIIPAFVHAELALLTKTLKAGMRDKEILSLQSILNRNPTTLVSTNGAGSKGQETEYFGKGTLEAVKKFQKINAAKILAPAGLTEPTGIVGSLTRAVINPYITGGETVGTGTAQDDDFLYLPPSDEETILTEAEAEAKYQAVMKRFGEVRSLHETKLTATRKQIDAANLKVGDSVRNVQMVLGQYEETVNALQDLENATVESDKLEFRVAIPSTPFPGTQLTIFGSKLKDSSAFHIGTQVLKITVADESGLIGTTIVPANMQPGKYETYITDGNTSTVKRNITVLARVVSDKTPDTPKVAVSSVETSRQLSGATITLRGYGFANSNSILTPFTTFDSVKSSDGKTLTFVLDKSLFTSGAVTPISFPVIVINENGLSSLTTVDVK